MAGNRFGNAITNELMYMANVLGQGLIPYAAPPSTLGPRIGKIPPSANGESYRRAELRLADAARAGGGGGGGGNAGYSVPNFRPIGGTPAERAQAAETSRVAQLTAQDPELQRYEAARLKAVGPGATPEQIQSAEDIGMQMWAKANPTLAAKVKAGQSGYEAIQGTLAGNMARAGQGFGITEQLVPTPQGFPTQVPGLPTGAGYSTGFGVTSNLAPGAQTPPPYSTIKPTSELSGLGAAPLGTAQTSVFGQPNVMDAAKFEELLKLVKK
jgi:hypothetical protein